MRRFRYAAAVAVAAGGGGAATRRSVATWYPGLRKPGWTPPSQVFAPVWIVLYAQMAYSANRVARLSDPGRRRALALWWLQLGLNAAWTPVFFGARRKGAAAAIIGALVPAIAATAAASARIDRRAGLLYAPYLAWSTYAAALNLEIWRRNRS
jgi:translocator protein